MIRISTIFIAICMVLIAASLGLMVYSLAGFTISESAIVALAALTFLILYNAVSMRLRDRTDVGAQIADLSRGTADLARQVAEFGRRMATIEARLSTTDANGQDRVQTVAAEISELGTLVKQLADSVAAHDEILSDAVSALAAQTSGDATADANAGVPSATPANAGPPASGQPADALPKPANINNAQLLVAVKNAIEASRIDLFLQPMVTLPQRKVRFYEAVARLRDDKDQVLTAGDFVGTAEAAGLMGQIDNMVMFRCVQVLRRLMVRSKDVGVFCNVAGATLSNPAVFSQCLDFLEANRVLAPSLVLEFKQSTFRHLGPVESEHLAALHRLGYGFSIDNVTDLRFDPRELADRGVKFVKVPASMLLDQKQLSSADIHAADLSDLLGRFGIDLVAERIEGERAVVDLLDYDVRFGQGFLFAPPRPLRPEGATTPAAEPAAAAKVTSAAPAVDAPARKEDKADVKTGPEALRATGNAALVSRSRASAQK
ncbi:EAL domain-containing protein [Bradyrhizobium sp. G127]|jgi:cyclic-di-GMP phosphodiesterase TipF (flagellum assembly factor)|uniref:EAL domain-containing protein n=1 Tax=Bradyrhizobium sp. G127 TaxID=2904800 RepID=UPI001F2E2D43|nr:EAL domain-containing protein [Bradyrhizobium sp. G127]MCF2522204.1 EAL domain-containing protein [Bradyrhizobium sp. G127]